MGEHEIADPATPPGEPSPWLTVIEAAARAKVGRKAIYYAVNTGQLKAARVLLRRELRIHREWLDAWLAASATVVNPHAPGAPHVLRGRR